MSEIPSVEKKSTTIDLRQLQNIELEILKELDRVCKKHGITYHLFGGTLIGAIRHKGFIPWDDDIDISMRREDYNKFIEVCSKELHSTFFLQNYKTDPNFFHSFVRIRKNGTKVIQRQYKDIDMHHGVFIDVFPFDNIPESNHLKKIQYKTLRANRIIKNFKLVKIDGKKGIRRLIKNVISIGVKPIPMAFFNVFETHVATLFNSKNTATSTLMVEAIQMNHKRCTVENDKFYETQLLEFEENKFVGPKYYEEILTNMYGDFMSMPKESERQPHHNIIEFEF